MLWLFAVLSLINSIVIIFLGEFILLKDSRNPLNRVFAAFCAVTGAWGFVEFMYRQSATLAAADFWIQAYAFVWPFSSPLALHFALVFTKKTKWLEKKSTYLLLYGPSALISATDFSTDLITPGPVKLPWGYATATPENQLYYWLGSSWVVFTGILGVLLVWRYGAQAGDLKEKNRPGLSLSASPCR